MSELNTIPNDYPMERNLPIMTAPELRQRLAAKYGIDGASPAERITQFKRLSVEGVAILLEDINKSVQGSEDSLMSHDKTIKIGNQNTLKPEDRYDVFTELLKNINNSAEDINPARIGDVLALGVVLLHPFKDGNGRTARVVGLIFHDNYDSGAYEEDFNLVTESRDVRRSKGGFVVNGYVPHFKEGFDQSNPTEVTAYLSSLLVEENKGAYTSCFDQARLKVDDQDR